MNETPMDLAAEVRSQLGEPSTAPALQVLLEGWGLTPTVRLPRGESSVYLEDKARGFCLVFNDASVVPDEAVKRHPPGTPVLVGCFLYRAGVDGYAQFDGNLPLDMRWGDTDETLVGRLGPPTSETRIFNKTTRASQRWRTEQGLVTARYQAGGVMKLVYIGLF